jgi:predicted transcriptional regulator
MPASTTLTIRLSPDTKAKLARLAEGTRRSRAFLAGEAVAAYVERELAIAEGIERGLVDVEAGRLVPHEEAMAELYAVIEGAGGGDGADGKADDEAAGRPA